MTMHQYGHGVGVGPHDRFGFSHGAFEPLLPFELELIRVELWLLYK